MTEWFGEPWPSAKRRAPICEDDTLQVPVPPEGDLCTFCDKPFAPGDRGIKMGHITAELTSEVRSVHLDCLLGNVGAGG